MSHPIFVGGTSSNAGKSWMATALCAWLRSKGVRVAPFKAQNMSNNSYPCKSGGEIGRAQVAQAWACGLDPEPAMNPILLKPNSDAGSQVVVNGRVWKTLSARDYYKHHNELFQVVIAAYQDLARRFDVIVIEGAGSVSEINLRQHDLVNLNLVTRLNVPWLLVGDIERGGVFASIIGTLNLLTEEERKLLRAFAINKFRGDRSLFDEGRLILEARTGCPCLGVFPYAQDIKLDAEDSLSLPSQSHVTADAHPSCAIIRFPRISNTTDFSRLSDAAWISDPVARQFDFVFLPGTKNTIADLLWLRAQGLEKWLHLQHDGGATIIGICGGYQMLGRKIIDPDGMESDHREAPGLNFLPMKTVLSREKITRVVQGSTLKGHKFGAYEIHLGETSALENSLPPFVTIDDNRPEGVRSGRVIGTYLHGILEDADVLDEIGIQVSEKTDRNNFQKLVEWFDPCGHTFVKLFLPELSSSKGVVTSGVPLVDS